MQANMENSIVTDHDVATMLQSVVETDDDSGAIQLQSEKVKHMFVGQLKDSLQKEEEVERALEQAKKRLCSIRKNWNKLKVKQSALEKKQNMSGKN